MRLTNGLCGICGSAIGVKTPARVTDALGLVHDACVAELAPGEINALVARRMGRSLGLAVLIAADEMGTTEVVGVVSSLGEAREIAASNLAGKLRRLERDQDPGLCPYEYYVHADVDGSGYTIVDSFLAAELPDARRVAPPATLTKFVALRHRRLCTDVRCELPADHKGPCRA